MHIDVLRYFLLRAVDVPDDRQAEGDVNPAKDRTFGGFFHDPKRFELLPAGRRRSDDVGELLEHLRPSELGPLERLFPERLRQIEAGMLEEQARAVAVRLEFERHPRVLDRSAR